MAEVTAAMVKELRERTGLGMMECKKALVAAGGSIEQAIEDLRKSGAAKAAKKAGRVAAEGVVIVQAAEDGSAAAIVEINSETDFVARDDGFLAFAEQVAEKAFSSRVTDIEKLLEGELGAARENLVQKIGENISPRRALILDAGHQVASYVHGNSRIGVLVDFEGGDAELGRDLAMHIAAASPMVVSPDDVPADVLAKEREIFAAQAQESGKPDNIIEKMVEGRVRKFLEEVSLVKQAFVKDPDQKIEALLKSKGATVHSFVRFEVGEGIEKEEADFAAEVMAQARGA